MAAAHGRSDQLEAGVRVGDFQIEKRLGAGGMGIVYQARQVSLDRRVALKVLGPALTHSADLSRFQREARAAARLKHPGIAAIHFIGQDEGVCYHVMEFVEGISLQRVVERLSGTREVQSSPDTVVEVELSSEQAAPALRFDQPTTDQESVHEAETPTMDRTPTTEAMAKSSLSPGARQTRRGPQFIRRVCEIVRDAARALAYAHGEGVIHRDIKPENLMLDRQGHVRIIDFGLARFFDDVSITQTGQLVGTPLYMSPEQVTGRFKVDHRSDIYSLGLVLYELLTLRRPFDAASRENLLRNIITKPLPPVRARNAVLSRDLEAIVHKATHKDPEERYQSAEDFAADLERSLAGKPVSAPPYRYRLDLEEVRARRPGAVVLAAFNLLMWGCAAFVLMAAVGTMSGVMMGMITVTILQAGFGTLLLGATAALSWWLLDGRDWARWLALILAVMVALGCLGGGALLASVATAYSGVPENTTSEPREGATKTRELDTRPFMLAMLAMYAVPLLLLLLSSATVCVCLLLRGTHGWFRLAGQTRREHREMLASLGE